jgi:hypothetical protein
VGDRGSGCPPCLGEGAGAAGTYVTGTNGYLLLLGFADGFGLGRIVRLVPGKGTEPGHGIGLGFGQAAIVRPDSSISLVASVSTASRFPRSCTVVAIASVAVSVLTFGSWLQSVQSLTVHV